MLQQVEKWWRVAWVGVRRVLRWLTPGLGIKRWLLVILLGTFLIGVGGAILVLDFYRTAPETWWTSYLSTLSLRFLERPLRVLVFGGLGVGLLVYGVLNMNRALLAPYMRPGRPVVDTLVDHRKRGRGHRIVVIGGGHGLSTLLRGLKAHTYNLTAIVTVADDGGSSGRLRDNMGVLPPGDIRNCLAALSNDETLITQLFQYRFPSGQGGLEGHSFGNLFISALSEITGSFEKAVAESGRVLSVHGQVLPATLHDVRLVADLSMPLSGEVRVHGESKIPEQPGAAVRRVWLEPNAPPAYPAAVRALLNADLIVVGPGSLYTSILPNLLVPDLAAALRNSPALKIFICNLSTQPGETDGYSCGDHVRALESHVGSHLFDVVIGNQPPEKPLPGGGEWVTIDEDLRNNYPLYLAQVADPQKPGQHMTDKLAQLLVDLLQERTGPLTREDDETSDVQ
ncbi:MAG: YvcK family protein [Anaerolineales bacterium]|nr:YvcK family protein [Anaerolineales bacterium]